MRLLIIGGAGYIGSHAVKYLADAGHDVWVYDNLSLGHAAAVPADRLIRGEVGDRAALAAAMRDRAIEAVMHFAAFAEVGQSVADPAIYYQNNVVAAIAMLDAMRDAGVTRVVFSSTTATYGVPQTIPIAETTPQAPINPYGFTKLVIERALADYAAAYGIGYAALRYFNAAGAHPDGNIGEHHEPESHLIPIVLQVALGQRESIKIFGDDYPTADGTCIRDYVHVCDLASAHAAALERIEPGRGLICNLGTGRGSSVREVIDACRRATGHPIPADVVARRPGDPPELVADASLAKKLLDWRAEYRSIDEIVATAWDWHRQHPRGYGDAA